jgi:hypothetical protein
MTMARKQRGRAKQVDDMLKDGEPWRRRSDRARCGARGGQIRRRLQPDSTLRPSISQIPGAPSLFCHRMSDLVSKLKSSV